MDGRIQQRHQFLIALTKLAENVGLGLKYIGDSLGVATSTKLFVKWMFVQRFTCDLLVLLLGTIEDLCKHIRRLRT